MDIRILKICQTLISECKTEKNGIQLETRNRTKLKKIWKKIWTKIEQNNKFEQNYKIWTILTIFEQYLNNIEQNWTKIEHEQIEQNLNKIWKKFEKKLNKN